MGLYSADFETTTDPNDCRVWAWAICEIGHHDSLVYGNTIETFIAYCSELGEASTIYFHNLRFDGEFILSYLLKNDYTHTTNKKINEKEFKTLISDRGVFYSIEMKFKRYNIKFYDSLKVLPFTVEQIAIAFNLPIRKLELDYNEYRAPDHILTEHEKDYISNDVSIVSQALEILFSQNLTKMTTGSNALSDFKNIIGKKEFERLFPIPKYDTDVRKSYKGGFTYLSPNNKLKDIKDGIVLDVNSLYPSVMYYRDMPYGEGLYFDGKYEKDAIYNLYVQKLGCQFDLKKGYIPTIQLKNNLAFVPTQYLESSNGEYIELTLTSVDLELFLLHYDVYDITWLGGWKFKSHKGIFKDYIDKWNKIKVESTKNGNKAMRTLAKLMLNSLYGKFALKPDVQSKIPYLEDGIVKYKLGEQEVRDPIYIPVGTFITAWARYTTITAAQSVYDRFIYADTDSLHLEGTEIPENLKISDTELGAWKHESTFTRARFLRQKSYIEEIDGELHITCAGMPEKLYDQVTFENFVPGTVYEGKLRVTHQRGGIVLLETIHTLRE